MSLLYDQEMIEVDVSEGPVPTDPAEAYIHSLMGALLREEWEQVLSQLGRAADVLTSPSETRELGVLLGAACFKPSVPLEFFRQCLSIDRRAATYQDGGLRTPLQMVVMYLDRPDLVRILVETTPECIHLRDIEGLRPIEIVTQKILMKEERFRYVGRSGRRTEDDEQSLRDHWECARLMSLQHAASAGEGEGQERHRRQLHPDTPLLHTFLQAPDTPLALRERALRRYSDQLQLPDGVSGNLPLHCMAQQVPQEDMDDLLDEVLNRYKDGARKRNNEGLWPLDLAIAAGRTWDSGIATLLDAFPQAVDNMNIPVEQFPMIFEELERRGPNGTTIVFAFVRVNPELISRAVR